MWYRLPTQHLSRQLSIAKIRHIVHPDLIFCKATQQDDLSSLHISTSMLNTVIRQGLYKMCLIDHETIMDEGIRRDNLDFVINRHESDTSKESE